MFICFLSNANGSCPLWFPGASIHACNFSGCHLVALAGDVAIFNVYWLLSAVVTCGSVPHTTNIANDDKYFQNVEFFFCICIKSIIK
jgi:hypothetical protein